MIEYEYALQTRCKGEERWYTLACRYEKLEWALTDRNLLKEHHDGIETRIVRRPKVKSWEVVE